MRLEQRIERLETIARESRSSEEGVFLSPRDVALLVIEQFNLGDSPDEQVFAERIDALLASHSRAIAGRDFPPPSPEEAHSAFVEALEHASDPGEAERLNKERFAKLMAL